MRSSVANSSILRREPRDVIAAVGGKEQFIEKMRSLFVESVESTREKTNEGYV
jgi:hypothetical protein